MIEIRYLFINNSGWLLVICTIFMFFMFFYVSLWLIVSDAYNKDIYLVWRLSTNQLYSMSLDDIQNNESWEQIDERIQVTFGLLIQNFRAVLTCYNSHLFTLATLHSQNSGCRIWACSSTTSYPKGSWAVVD